MEVEELPFCCGFKILGEFYESNFDEHLDDKKNFIKELRTVVRDLRQFTCLCSLTDEQAKSIGSDIKSVGFEEVYRYKNPNSSSFVTLFIKKKIRKPRKRIKVQ